MPYPSQINRQQIVQAAREFIEKESVETLTLSKLAATLGVKAPSLYRHVANKEALLQAINLLTLKEMGSKLDRAKQPDATPREQVAQIMQAYRAFAHAQADLYLLAMATKPGEGRPDEDVLVEIVMPLQIVVAQISGEASGLAALRGLFALAHGYVMLELNQQFQRGGDLSKTFEEAISAYLSGWE